MPDTEGTAEPLPARLLQDTASMFALLSATVRLHILWLLTGGDRDVGTLADETGQSIATVSHHLGKLKLAGLVDSRRAGKRQIYVVADPHCRSSVSTRMRLEQSQPGRRARDA
jgi:DNA-binding transcriptional ArsR family regulator